MRSSHSKRRKIDVYGIRVINRHNGPVTRSLTKLRASELRNAVLFNEDLSTAIISFLNISEFSESVITVCKFFCELPNKVDCRKIFLQMIQTDFGTNGIDNKQGFMQSMPITQVCVYTTISENENTFFKFLRRIRQKMFRKWSLCMFVPKCTFFRKLCFRQKAARLC